MNDPRATPARIDFEMVSGDTKVLRVEIQDRKGNPYSLAGCTAAVWKVARSAAGETLIEKTLAGSGGIAVIQDGARWFLEIALEPEDTAGLQGALFHEAEFREGAAVTTAWRGTLALVVDSIDAT